MLSIYCQAGNNLYTPCHGCCIALTSYILQKEIKLIVDFLKKQSIDEEKLMYWWGGVTTDT